MTRRDKLLARFKSKPLDFSWDELKTLLAGFGYEPAASGRTGGSRVRFVHPELPPILMHKPHPTPYLKRYQIEQLFEFFRKEGLL